ncbi:MAG: 3-oxoacyl-[acyl-carrier-protein] reductase [Elusimicrobia bacterium]|nr:3-oxoacyl-[acyl-carrier-protein] reductase [Elusimicrobiota bacterium]
MRVKDQVAIITGGAQGIGKATADLLLKEGARVVICDVDESMVQSTAQAMGENALGLKADVTVMSDCESVVKKAVDKFGKLDILVNNAGITRDNLLIRMTDSEWDLVLSINLKGAFNFTRAAAKVMLRARRGRMINIASVVGQMGNPGQANYAASKGGLIAFTKACAKEFASRNINVNAIAPGFIKTRLTDILSDDAKQKLYTMIPMERFGEPEDVAKGVLFLASEDASYITGQVLGINGGMYV